MELALNPETNFTPAQIYSLLERTEGFQGRLPSIRTVQRMVKEFRGEKPSPSWHWSDYQGEDARVILDVLKAINERTWPYPGKPRMLTKEEADWVVKISKVASGLKPMLIFELARTYVVWQQLGATAISLDFFLAMMPWKDKTSLERYLEPGRDEWIEDMEFGLGLSGVVLRLFDDLGADLCHWKRTGKVSERKG